MSKTNCNKLRSLGETLQHLLMDPDKSKIRKCVTFGKTNSAIKKACACRLIQDDVG